jgi:hypothetical protein
MWIRTPTWITSGYASTPAGPNGGNFECKFLSQRWVLCEAESYKIPKNKNRNLEKIQNITENTSKISKLP